MRRTLKIRAIIASYSGIAAATLGVCGSLITPAFADPSVKDFEVYGFAQADYIQDFNRVDPDWDDTLRPSKIPTQDDQFGSDGQASISVKQSRLGVKAALPVEGDKIFTKFEIDLFGVGVDAGQTTLRARHIYGEYGQILAGQTNSLFMDVDIFPNIIDYWGPAGMVFLRNPQFRWTPIKGEHNFAVAIEKPSNDIDAGDVRQIDPAIGDNIKADDDIPDFTAQYRYQGDSWGHVQLAGIIRKLGVETENSTGDKFDDTAVGWGTDLTSVINVMEHDYIRVGTVIGNGIASYMNDGGTDMAPEGVPGSLDAKAVFLWGISAYYDHAWNDKFTTSIGYARTQVDNTNFQSDSSFHSGDYASVNLLYTPVKNVMFGGEFLWGARTDNNGDRGDDLRTQVSAKYSFSSSDFWTGS